MNADPDDGRPTGCMTSLAFYRFSRKTRKNPDGQNRRAGGASGDRGLN